LVDPQQNAIMQGGLIIGFSLAQLTVERHVAAMIAQILEILSRMVQPPPILSAVAAPLLAFAAETAAVGWRHCSLRRLLFQLDGSQRTDLLMFGICISGAMPILMAALTLGGSYAVGSAIQKLTFAMAGLDLRLDAGNAITNFGLYVLGASFIDYWEHRLFHVRPFWELHKLHHSATSMNPLVMHRTHPANLLAVPFVYGLPLALVAAPAWSTSIFMGLIVFYQLLVHSEVPWSWGWFGRWILISPAAHRIHHSTNPEHYGKNLSTSLVIWDRLFGTWYSGTVPVLAVGVPGLRQRGFFSQCFNDLLLFWRGARSRISVASAIQPCRRQTSPNTRAVNWGDKLLDPNPTQRSLSASPKT
jgi:sterol desaturase/sphingolipid hydroxylase (fatty acid hydroxylase superfamily)